MCKTKYGDLNDKNALCLSFYVVNDNNIVDGRKYQIMHCMFCHSSYHF
jgi:hypothetical protein